MVYNVGNPATIGGKKYEEKSIIARWIRRFCIRRLRPEPTSNQREYCGFEGCFGEHAISEINLKNLDANLSFVGFPTAENNSVRGTDLQAYASFKYTEFSMKAADIDTYDELLYVSTTNGERHDAKFYLDNGDAYLDLSNIGIDSMRVEGEDEPVSNQKMRFAGVLADTLIQVNAASSVFDSVPMMMGMSEAEFDNYVLKTALEFKKSGDATEAIANIDAAKLRSIYVSQGLADYYANTLPDIP